MKVMKATIYIVDTEHDDPKNRFHDELELRGFSSYVSEDIKITKLEKTPECVQRLIEKLI